MGVTRSAAATATESTQGVLDEETRQQLQQQQRRRLTALSVSARRFEPRGYFRRNVGQCAWTSRAANMANLSEIQLGEDIMGYLTVALVDGTTRFKLAFRSTSTSVVRQRTSRPPGSRSLSLESPDPSNLRRVGLTPSYNRTWRSRCATSWASSSRTSLG